jgi:hypothetical protein
MVNQIITASGKRIESKRSDHALADGAEWGWRT